METSVSIESFDLENARQMQSEENDDDACDPGQGVFVDPEQLANLGGGRPQHNKNYAEAKNEADRVHHHAPNEVRLRRLEFFRPAPEIRERYPGTSGSTQGERNEMSPAKKAAIGSGRLDMRPLLYLPEFFFVSNQTIGAEISCTPRQDSKRDVAGA